MAVTRKTQPEPARHQEASDDEDEAAHKLSQPNPQGHSPFAPPLGVLGCLPAFFSFSLLSFSSA